MMNSIKKIMANALIVCSGIALISAISLIMALIAQYIYGLQPCTLCLYQRWPYVVAGLLGVCGMIVLRRQEGEKLASLFVFLAALTFFAGGLIAFYHSGVERHWWVSILEGCAVDFNAGNAKDLMALLDSKPAVRCDEIPWADPVFGLSMANYNALFSPVLAVGCFISSVLIKRKANGIL